MRALIIGILAIVCVSHLCAEDAERFKLKDGRTFIGWFDPDTNTLSLSVENGHVSFHVVAEDIATRRPATADEMRPRSPVPAQQPAPLAAAQGPAAAPAIEKMTLYRFSLVRPNTPTLVRCRIMGGDPDGLDNRGQRYIPLEIYDIDGTWSRITALYPQSGSQAKELLDKLEASKLLLVELTLSRAPRDRIVVSDLKFSQPAP